MRGVCEAHYVMPRELGCPLVVCVSACSVVLVICLLLMCILSLRED